MRKFVLLFSLISLYLPVQPAFAEDEIVSAEDVFTHILSPAPLNANHEMLAGVVNCGKCHSMTTGVSEKKCLDCHKKIQQRVALKQGYHATLGKACLQCHTGHKQDIIRFKPESFNHRLSQFPLTGKHADVKCQKCHMQPVKTSNRKRFTYLGLPLQCAGCHKNIHGSESMAKCQSCHNSTGWRLDNFVHAEKTSFPLLGLHKIVPCQKCHKEMTGGKKDKLQFKVKNHQSCLTCHKDTHKGKLNLDCLSCHTMNGWRGSNLFQHDKARFKLEGKHQGVKCVSCHRDNQFKGLKYSDCSDCHQKKTAHKDRINRCRACHQPEGWLILSANMVESRELHVQMHYQLKGAHAKVECQKCHNRDGVNNYFNLPAGQCSDCHKDPHKGELAKTCDGCHLETSFKDLQLFDHQKALFKLDSSHKKLKCKVCHTGKDYKKTPAECGECHVEVTKFARGIWGDNWREGRIISPKARIVSCAYCHKPGQTGKVTGENCLDCHDKVYQQFFATRAILATETIAGIRQKLERGDLDAVLVEEIRSTLQFVEKNYFHNYRLADQALSDIERQLSEAKP